MTAEIQSIFIIRCNIRDDVIYTVKINLSLVMKYKHLWEVCATYYTIYFFFSLKKKKSFQEREIRQYEDE